MGFGVLGLGFGVRVLGFGFGVQGFGRACDTAKELAVFRGLYTTLDESKIIFALKFDTRVGGTHRSLLHSVPGFRAKAYPRPGPRP